MNVFIPPVPPNCLMLQESFVPPGRKKYSTWRSWSKKSSWILVDSASVVVEVRSFSKFKIVCSSFHADAIEQIWKKNQAANGPLLVQPLLPKEASLANLSGISLLSLEEWALHDPSENPSTSWAFPTLHFGFCIVHILKRTPVIDGNIKKTSDQIRPAS